MHLSLSTNLQYRGIVLQRQVFLPLPEQIEYYHQDQSLLTGIVRGQSLFNS